MNCKNLKIRHKKGQVYYYCTSKKSIVELRNCQGCLDKEYKQYKILNKTKPTKRTKSLSIDKKTKLIVWERDNKRCIFCHCEVEWNLANSHFIKRSHGGLGIEQNIFCACLDCHHKFDDTTDRTWMLPIAKEYLKSKYINWNEKNLVYKKMSK